MATEEVRMDGLEHQWILDFGAIRHTTNNLNLLTYVRETNSPVVMGYGSLVDVKLIETITEVAEVQEECRTI